MCSSHSVPRSGWREVRGALTVRANDSALKAYRTPQRTGSSSWAQAFRNRGRASEKFIEREIFRRREYLSAASAPHWRPAMSRADIFDIDDVKPGLSMRIPGIRKYKMLRPVGVG